MAVRLLIRRPSFRSPHFFLNFLTSISLRLSKGFL